MDVVANNIYEYNQLKQELDKLKVDFQNLFDENASAMLIADRNTATFVAVNKAATKMYGYSTDDFLNLTLDDLNKSKLGNNLPDLHLSYTHHFSKSGDSLFVETNKKEIVYNGRDCDLITVIDITEIVLSQEKEKKARQRLDAVFSCTNDAILLTDDNGKYVQVNKAACTVLGYTEEELLSLSVVDVVADVNSKIQETALWNEFINDGSQTGIIELKKKNREIIICHYNATANVLPGLHLSILTDITGRETASRKIEEQAKFIECIVESITDCFFVVDKNWIVKYWNKAAEQLLRKPKEQMIGCSLWDIYKDAADLLFFRHYQMAMIERVPLRFEEHLSSYDVWVDVSVYPFNDGLTIYFKDITTTKKQALETLLDRKNQYALINATSDMIWSVDTNMRLVSFNSAYSNRLKNVTGVAAFIGRQLPSSFFNNEQNDRWVNYYKKALNGEVFSIDESFVDNKTGEVKLAEIRFNPIFGVDGNIAGAVCNSRNVTDRVRSQLLIEEQNIRLKASERHLEKITARLQKVLDSSLDVICAINKEGLFTQVSRASVNVWGYTPEEIIGEEFMRFVHPDDREATIQAAKEVITGKSFTNFQNVYIHKNGSLVPLMWSARWDEDEEIMFCVGRDATALKEAEKLSEAVHKRYESLIQKGVDLVSIIDTKGCYMFVSPNSEKVLGYKTERLMHMDALQLIHSEDMSYAKAALQSVVNGGEIKLEAFRYKHGSGEWRWFETIATNQLDNPAIGGIVLNSRDITTRKQIEAERELMIQDLLKSNADLKQFSFITSHNLRAPLSNILGILNIIEYKNLDDYNVRMIQMLDTSTKQLQQTIDDLSKILIIKNNINIEISSIDLVDAVNEIKAMFANTFNEMGVDVITDFRVNKINFNRTYFESILENLLSNSIKYRSRKRGLVITISSHLDANGNTIFRFSDNGLGIDLLRHRDKVFGLYQRFHNNIEGHGLGLFIVRSQIVALGGTIEIQSEPDKGATFIITFKKHSDNFTDEEL